MSVAPHILTAIEQGDAKAADKLAAQNKPEAELAKLRFFVGLTLEEAAVVLGLSPRTADNYWPPARAWLFLELKSQKG